MFYISSSVNYLKEKFQLKDVSNFRVLRLLTNFTIKQNFPFNIKSYVNKICLYSLVTYVLEIIFIQAKFKKVSQGTLRCCHFLYPQKHILICCARATRSTDVALPSCSLLTKLVRLALAVKNNYWIKLLKNHKSYKRNCKAFSELAGFFHVRLPNLVIYYVAQYTRSHFEY